MVVLTEGTHYISYPSLSIHIYLFFIKFMTYFDKSFRKYSIQCNIITKTKN